MHEIGGEGVAVVNDGGGPQSREGVADNPPRNNAQGQVKDFGSDAKVVGGKV